METTRPTEVQPEMQQSQPAIDNSTLATSDGIGSGAPPQLASGAIEVLCGPLLNYRRMGSPTPGAPIWYGSVLIVTRPTTSTPTMGIAYAGPAGAVDGAAVQPANTPAPQTVSGVKLYEDVQKSFWRFSIEVPFQQVESKWQYEVLNITSSDGSTSALRSFVVPSIAQSMRILFHSCNGFSVGTDVDAWSGPALWHDVLRMHAQQPFHVMIGGGDQIYNDGVRVEGPLKAWTDIGNPKKRRDFPFNESLRAECDEYYFQNYVRWYGTEPFKTANAQIPQVNIWDDHDIIDGFGSYTDHFMRCAVFRGIGGVAHK